MVIEEVTHYGNFYMRREYNGTADHSDIAEWLADSTLPSSIKNRDAAAMALSLGSREYWIGWTHYRILSV